MKKLDLIFNAFFILDLWNTRLFYIEEIFGWHSKKEFQVIEKKLLKISTMYPIFSHTNHFNKIFLKIKKYLLSFI